MSTTIGSDGYSLSIRFYKYERSKSKINMLNCCAMIAVANIAKGVSDLNWLPKVSSLLREERH